MCHYWNEEKTLFLSALCCCRRRARIAQIDVASVKRLKKKEKKKNKGNEKQGEQSRERELFARLNIGVETQRGYNVLKHR